MTSPPSQALLPSAVIQRAYLQAWLLLDARSSAQALVHRTLVIAGSQYAHAIKQAPQPLFQRLLHCQLRRAHLQLQWQHWWSTWLTRLIPPREEDLTPSPLERWPVITANTPALWFDQAASGGLILEILRILPTRQRQAFWLREIEDLPALAVARILACTRYQVRRHAARAHDTLTTILAMKGCPTAELTREQLTAGINQALSAWLRTLPSETQQALQHAGADLSPAVEQSNGRARWRQYHALHPLGSRLTLIAVLLFLSLLGWQLTRPDTDLPPAQQEIQLLAGDAPLSVLLDPHFDEASHD